MKISDVLDQIGKDVLSEQSKKLLSEAFEESAKTKANEIVTLEVENALKRLDEEHSTKLEQLLEAIDEDHTTKLHAVLEKVDQDHTNKLKYIISKYQRVITEDAKTFKKNLTEQLSSYLDLYVKEKFPEQEIKEAVQNVQSRKMIDKIKEIVAIDEAFIDGTIKEAVQDGNKTIEALRNDLNESVKANIQINQELKNQKAELIIEKKTAGFDKTKKDFVLRSLKGKDPEFIAENFDYVVKMFEKDEDKNTQILTEEARKKSTVVTEKVETPASRIKDESLVNESAGNPVTGYLSMLKSQDNRFKQ